MEKYGIRYWGLLLGIVGITSAIIYNRTSHPTLPCIYEEAIDSTASIQDSIRWDSIIKEYREHESDGEITL